MMQGISSLGGIYNTYVISDRHFVVLTTKHCSNFGGKGRGGQSLRHIGIKKESIRVVSQETMATSDSRSHPFEFTISPPSLCHLWNHGHMNDDHVGQEFRRLTSYLSVFQLFDNTKYYSLWSWVLLVYPSVILVLFCNDNGILQYIPPPNKGI